MRYKIKNEALRQSALNDPVLHCALKLADLVGARYDCALENALLALLAEKASLQEKFLIRTNDEQRAVNGVAVPAEPGWYWVEICLREWRPVFYDGKAWQDATAGIIQWRQIGEKISPPTPSWRRESAAAGSN